MKLKHIVKKFFYIDYLMNELRNALYHEGLAGGIRYLKTRYRFMKPAAVRFLLELAYASYGN